MEAGSTSNATTNGHSQSPWDAHEASAAAGGKPEIPVIAALVGGFVLARVLKALGGDDD